MADFTQKTVIKPAVRQLASPVLKYLTYSDHSCYPDQQSGGLYYIWGVSHSPVEGIKKDYVATIVYENAEAKTVGTIPVKGPTMAAVNTAVTQITGNATIIGAIGAGVSASRDSSGDTFSKTLKCHASNRYFLSPIRSIIPFPMRPILSGPTLVTWADTVFQPEQNFLSEGC